MTGFPVTIVPSGGYPVTDTDGAAPAQEVESGGYPITLVEAGGLPLKVERVAGGGAGAGITYVGGKTAVATAGAGTTTVSLTNLTGGSDAAPQAGDVVVVGYSIGSNVDIDVSVTGYVEVADLLSTDTFRENLGIYYKVMGGTPDTSLTLGATTNANFGGVCAIQVWRGVDTTNVLDVAAQTATGADSRRANPPSITPTTSGAVIVAIGGTTAYGVVFQTPSDLENWLTALAGTAYNNPIGMGSKAWTGGAFDPVEFGVNTDSTSSCWAAATIALRPA